MGGIETGGDVKNMMDAGADFVGIGSLFASVHPDDWKDFFPALKEDALRGDDNSPAWRSRSEKMKYQPRRVKNIQDLPGDVRVLELDGSLPFKAGEFVFLYIPGTGEKPFAVMKSSPPTFMIRKRGAFTSGVMELEKESLIFTRGSYGKESPGTDKKNVFIAAGGLGEDVYLSVETPTRCGVGLCGECECGGHLTCREGTFFTYSYLKGLSPDIGDLIHED